MLAVQAQMPYKRQTHTVAEIFATCVTKKTRKVANVKQTIICFLLCAAVVCWADDPPGIDEDDWRIEDDLENLVEEDDGPRFDSSESWEVCSAGEIQEKTIPTPACGFNDAGSPKPGLHACGAKPPSCEQHCQLLECLPDP